MKLCVSIAYIIIITIIFISTSSTYIQHKYYVNRQDKKCKKLQKSV